MSLLLGLDVGTSGCKVIATDEKGVVLASSSDTYPTRYPKPGWAEQDPREWYRATCKAVRECIDSAGLDAREVAGIAVDGPAHNVALLDESGNVIYPTIHWSDLRSAPQCETLKRSHGDRIFQITFQQPNPSWTLPQLMWLKENEPSVWSRLRRIMVTKDYVRYRMTGLYQTDVYDAVGTQLYDVKAGCWSTELGELLGFDQNWLPEVLPATAIGGELTAGAAHETGLPPGIPVAVGSGDSVIEAFGVGVVDPGQCLVKIGTAANVDLVGERPYPSQLTITYPHAVPGRWIAICPTNSGASTLRWFRDTFCRHEAIGANGTNPYDLIERLAAEAPPGCEGLMFHPYLMGERGPYWDPLLRGDFVGISARHQTQHFARAVMEGVAFSIRDCFHVIESLELPITNRRLVGGGAKSRLWRQILCDVLGTSLLKPAAEDAALGAALLAGVAVGIFPDWQSAARLGASVEEELLPDPETHAMYNQYFETYRAVTDDLTAHSHRLAVLADRWTSSASTVIQ